MTHAVDAATPPAQAILRQPTPVPSPPPAMLLRDQLRRDADRHLPPRPRPKPAPPQPTPSPAVTLPWRPRPMPGHIPTGVLGVCRWLLTPPPLPDDEEACRGHA